MVRGAHPADSTELEKFEQQTETWSQPFPETYNDRCCLSHQQGGREWVLLDKSFVSQDPQSPWFLCTVQKGVPFKLAPFCLIEMTLGLLACVELWLVEKIVGAYFAKDSGIS